MADQRDGGIAWTDESWNPIRGCSRISEGCRNCYAESVARRFSGPGQPYEGLVEIGAKGARWNGTTRFVVEHIADPVRWRRPRRIFVNSMSDLFHESIPDWTIDQVFGVMAACRFLGRDARPGHTFQVLTKRPERMREYLAVDRRREWARAAVSYGGGFDSDGIYDQTLLGPRELPHVFLGVSVEDQSSADDRIWHLMRAVVARRFVSYEPAIGPVNFQRVGWGGDWIDATAGLDWIIVGGESGPGARPFDLAWARSVIEQTRGTGCKVFVKQLGAKPFHTPCVPGTFLYTMESLELRDRKGGDMSEWPGDLRVREFPEVSRG